MLTRSSSHTKLAGLLGAPKRISSCVHQVIAAATPPPARRTLFTLSTSASYCSKGSLTYYNRESGDDALVNATWIVPGPHQGASLLGVADGVGGWRKYGIDPSNLSHGLCRELVRSFELQEGHCSSVPRPKALLQSAFRKLQREGETYAGGTTACVGTFDPSSGKLTVANLGDSGFIVLRKGRILYASERDAVGLVPRQLAIPTQKLVEIKRLAYESAGQVLQRPAWMETDPTDAAVAEIELEHGDVVIFGTDGLFDNVYNSFILQTVTSSMLASSSWSDKTGQFTCNSNITGGEELSEMLVKRAYYNSLDPHFASPFATRTFQAGMMFPGGKPDDISVLVATVNAVPEISSDYASWTNAMMGPGPTAFA